ncbi:hypothetical protein [Chamaesiphon polymorphus]|uniref:Uncharacterized protein n=1 Tax=Chamaesiphon polymorphus CCALA 037 TaxID=2107692 RepID=A0A2T1GFG3_9CYAN|nr:hypothetical protein [Chamaesiphon polymorphus]PSB56321.1 hypothetical protein C7B77_12260 [Chamaesiphon polymorphus CCALA 037]
MSAIDYQLLKNMSFLRHSLILADVAPNAGFTRNFEYCIKITNLNKYPNYLLFAQIRSPTSKPGAYVQIQADRCMLVDGYRPSVNIAAIAKSSVQKSDLAKNNLGTILKNNKLQKSLITGTPSIERPLSVPIINSGKKIEASFEIQSLNRQGLKLVRVPESTQILNVLLFPTIGIAILGWIVWKRQHKTVDR